MLRLTVRLNQHLHCICRARCLLDILPCAMVHGTSHLIRLWFVLRSTVCGCMCLWKYWPVHCNAENKHAFVHADAANEEAAIPLHCAALAGSLECARLLIERGASTSSVSKSGRWGFSSTARKSVECS